MKRSIVMLSLLSLVLLAGSPALGGPPADNAPDEPTAEAPAPDVEVGLACTDEAVANQDLLLPEPEPQSCTMFQCKTQCRAICPELCWCTGECVGGNCECKVLC